MDVSFDNPHEITATETLTTEAEEPDTHVSIVNW